MNKRSKSQLCLKLAEENAKFHEKVQQSKPILQNIYDKVKRKEKCLIDRIYKDKQSISEIKKVAKDYKNLYEDSVRIMQKGGLFQKFEKSKSNYIKTVPIQQAAPLKHKSIYEQYKQRINRLTANVEQQKNIEMNAFRIKNEQLKTQIQDDIERLRLVRQKSQNRLRKTQSSSILPKNRTKLAQMQGKDIKGILADKKKQYLAGIQ